MKLARPILALLSGVLFLTAGPVKADPLPMPTIVAQAGGAGSRAAAATPDSIRIPAPAARDPAPAASMNLLEVIQHGGWAMYPLAFLSVITLMLVIVYLFTLRRSSILSAHFMNTADVLLKKRDHLGLLAISSRHSETIARVV